MAAPSTRLAARIRRDFPEAGSGDAIIASLGELDTTERVQAAIVLWARGDLNRFRDSVVLSYVDWRDVLVRGGLENEDWPQVLVRELGD